MFTQKLSMDCTQEQYEKYLKLELEKMGYKESSINCWTDDSYQSIANNYMGFDGSLGTINKDDKTMHSRTYLGKFNATLFLALAAMTDNWKGNYGELWRNKEAELRYINDWWKQDNVMGANNQWRKATVSEIMAKFGEQKKAESITIAIDITNHSDEEQTFVATEKQMISFLTSRGYNVSIVNDSPALENILAEKNMITRLKSKGYRIFKQTTTLEEL